MIRFRPLESHPIRHQLTRRGEEQKYACVLWSGHTRLLAGAGRLPDSFAITLSAILSTAHFRARH